MLSLQFLRTKFHPMFFGNISNTSFQNAVQNWLNSYSLYAKTAIAGPTIPVISSVFTVISGDFYSSFSDSVSAMWMSAQWIGPGFTGITTFVPSMEQPLKNIGKMLTSIRNADTALDNIVNVIHTYTLGIVVNVANAAGVITPTKIT